MKGPKKSEPAVLKDWGDKAGAKAEIVSYSAEFEVDSNFGLPGAITILNKHHQEFFLDSITVEGFSRGPVHFPCSSWIQSRKDLPKKRVFFSNQPYLPHETPEGLRALREEELRDLRGDGSGVRQLHDRIYDFDVYNDLGNPDKGIDYVRPTLGGDGNIPYPRRCRTGRVPCVTDTKCESRLEKPAQMYVPRDEQFEEPKRDAFLSARLRGTMHNLIPGLQVKLSAKKSDFGGFEDLDSIYGETLFRKLGIDQNLLERLPLPQLVRKFKDADIFKFNTPMILQKDKLAWLRDEEFGRQILAGICPVHVERLRTYPPISKLDPSQYGPVDSALKNEHILPYLNGMSVQEALDSNKLYIVDYHDIYLPFVDRINALDGRAVYATRTVLFLTGDGTLKPIAIELCLPGNGLASRSRVVTPNGNATSFWMWQIGKAHVWANDASVHQLVHHWLRTHAAMEVFILSAHRQMSAMHPIFKLLDPHMRYTLEINALARQSLISNEGVVESCFTPGRYAMQISSAAYKNFWRFDLENLPADLVRRGMAVPDPTQPHGLKLLIEDYPYATDGLLIWEAIQKYVTSYVNRYYPDADRVCSDRELQSWYAESVNVGHADMRNADWWPTLASPEDLCSILTTIIWLSSAQHAALNFGQYPYGGYLPNRPTLMRRLIPDENDPEYAGFVSDPEAYFFKALPSKLDATKLIAVIDTLSTHSPDEEYLGERQHPSTWTADAAMVEAFCELSADIVQIEEEIERRNRDPRLKNRCGAGVIPYELLAPSSPPGVTCRGVPNSVTI
ncbi:unnamed protein product [Cuscuta campestris]|uniref:Lipoxygenase n=1 Tax=Cuscuta campestris TaxID=132261 RepID=A0A484K6Y7_9ASTE|nr:unnamed protein product [Cuscuta campestris]